MKIYTKTGDEGKTSLLGGTRVLKDHIRISAYGTLDELNAHLGLLRDLSSTAERKDLLLRIQNNLFVIASRLASENERAKNFSPEVDENEIEILEQEIDKMEDGLAPLKFFILPGGHQTVSFCHIARTVCRRAEREIISLSQQNPVELRVIKYINRLSDFLFVLARQYAKELNVEEVAWKSRE